MILRPVTPTDADAILGIWNPLIRDSEATFNAVEKTRADILDLHAAKATAGHAFLVAEGPGGIAGFALYGQFRAGSGYARCMEHTVILRPAARGRGIGRALMAAIEDHARTGGAHTMVAGISSANPGAIRFHSALGYAQVATLPAVGYKFGRWYDLHLMQKVLDG